MPDIKDRSIALQNATNAAAAIYAAIYPGQEFNVDAFERIRTEIWTGTEDHVRAIVEEAVTEAFPGAVSANQVDDRVLDGTAPLAPATGPAPLAAAPAPGPGPAPIPNAAPDDDTLWRHVFDHYDEWYDNRKDKADPNSRATKKSPDFKRKSDGAALWADSKNTPPWVTEKLNAA